MSYLKHFKNLYKEYGVEIDKFNLFGIRNEENQEQDEWNDYIGFFTDINIYFFKGTTDPGYYYTKNPVNKDGTAHLCLGFHKQIWKIGLHKGKYEAFCNKWPCNKTRIWRDFDADGELDYSDEKIYTGYFGINLHRANEDYLVSTVGKYSAGCQVVRNNNSFQFILEEAKKSGLEKFSYFLFNKNQINFFDDLQKGGLLEV